MQLLRLATRNSPLALWQARWVAARLRRRFPRLVVRLVPLASSGDHDRTTPLYASASVGVFVREIQAAVLEGRADAGVHSLKDLPTTAPAGLALAAVLPRADVRDALITGDGRGLDDLPPGALIGTSSLRRQCQLAALRSDLRFTSIRGNVDTRLRKVREGQVAATLLAMAGLHRLGLVIPSRAQPLDPWRTCVPAPAQGAVGLDCRADDHPTRERLLAISDLATWRAVTIERRILAAMEGGCTLPLGVLVRRSAGRWSGRVALGAVDRPLRTWDLSGDPATWLASLADALASRQEPARPGHGH